jgi:hypothetical protein
LTVILDHYVQTPVLDPTEDLKNNKPHRHGLVGDMAGTQRARMNCYKEATEFYGGSGEKLAGGSSIWKRTLKVGLNFFIIIHLFTCVYIVWVISPPCSLPPPRIEF